MRHLVRFGAYPILVFGAVVGAAILLSWGIQPTTILFLSGALAACAIRALELAYPFTGLWNRSRHDRLADTIHLGVSAAVADATVRALVFIFLAASVAAPLAPVAPLSGHKLWPTHWPLAAQLLLALVLSEFGGYWSHRLMHRVPVLWRFHAVHHSAERLYFGNAFRNHPGDVAFGALASALPLAALGAPETIFVLLSAFATVHLFMQHANVDYALGPFAQVFSTAEVHRWHHSRNRQEADGNYGNLLLVFDHLFGTFRFPAAARPPESVGLGDGRAMGSGYLAQLRSPFT